MSAWRIKHSARLLAEAANGFPGVYFVQTGEFVKIGVSDDVRGRLRGLTCSSPYDMVPLGYIPGNVEEIDELEASVHERFKELRHRGEWFRFEAELRAFIAEHAQPWPAYWPGREEYELTMEAKNCSP